MYDVFFVARTARTAAWRIQRRRYGVFGKSTVIAKVKAHCWLTIYNTGYLVTQ